MIGQRVTFINASSEPLKIIVYIGIDSSSEPILAEASIPIRFIIIMENIAHAIKIAVCLANIDQYRHTEHFIPALNRKYGFQPITIISMLIRAPNNTPFSP